ncbi:MAG: sugar diacid recognition domain-containing protein [Thermovirgaceae bacterium]|nr:sugar diacid recognition domain-containing protein [Thermovirgaceae bacterium]
MLRRFAQEICDTTHEIIGHHVLVTDENAVIIGSSDPVRILKIHDPSIIVMKQRIETYTDEREAADLNGVKPGVTLPVCLAGEVVGSIAIAGDHREVSRFGHLVQKQAELFLRERLILESAGARERALRELVGDIAAFAPDQDDSGVIATRGRELGYDLEMPRVCLVLEISSPDTNVLERLNDPIRRISILSDIQDILRTIFPEPSCFASALGPNRYAVFPAVEISQLSAWFEPIGERCRKCAAGTAEIGLTLSTGVGTYAKSVEELHFSYCDAWKALSIGLRKKEPGRIHRIEDYLVEDLLTTVNIRKGRRFSQMMLESFRKLSDREEMLRTFKAWCEFPCSPGTVAEKLNIHRNTLQYRLDKIQKVTGADPRSFRQAFSLYLALALDMLHE